MSDHTFTALAMIVSLILIATALYVAVRYEAENNRLRVENLRLRKELMLPSVNDKDAIELGGAIRDYIIHNRDELVDADDMVWRLHSDEQIGKFVLRLIQQSDYSVPK